MSEWPLRFIFFARLVRRFAVTILFRCHPHSPQITADSASPFSHDVIPPRKMQKRKERRHISSGSFSASAVEWTISLSD